MSGPYAEGLGSRKRKHSDFTEDQGEDDQHFFLASDEEEVPLTKKTRRISPTEAEVIPKFRPDEKTSNVIGWLNKIDQLGDVYGWNNKDRQFIMQIRLRGSARDWYDDLEDYSLSWDGWKEALRTAFPRSTDFADRLEQMMARNKVNSESMTKFYHEKLSLLKKCNIQGEDAISCIIRGLPHELRANAKAYKCDTPEQLYYGYLSSLENYKQVEATQLARKSVWKRGSIEPSSTYTQNQLLPKKCYVCRRTGHEARDCRLQPRCEYCQRFGHTTATCWRSPGTSNSLQAYKVSNVLHVTYDIFLDLYKKNVTINGQHIVAYVDTGSKLNIMSLKKAQELQLVVEPSNVVMKGFGGAYSRSLGSCELVLSIDDVCLTGSVEITNYKLTDIDMIVGQTMINQDNVSLIITKNYVKFIPTCNLSFELSDIQLDSRDFDSKFPVYLKSQAIIPRQSSMFVEVYVNDIYDLGCKREHTLLTNSVWVQIGGTSYHIPETLINLIGSHLKVTNVGNDDISWPSNKILTRATIIDQEKVNADSSYVLAVDSCNSNKCSEIKLSDIDVGDLEGDETLQLLNLLNEFSHTFAHDSRDLGCTDLIRMHIQTVTDRPVFRKPYRLSHKENEIVNEKIRDLLDAGIIRESSSDYASPVVLVKKKGGDYRLCVDYRALNACTVKDRYPLPHIEDQVTRLSGKTFFTTLDLAQGYYQVPLNEESIGKTAFVTPSGQYEFLKMPFGLANAPAVFSRLIQLTLGKVSQDIALYLDDVMIPTSTTHEGLKLLRQVLQLLTDANLKLNLKKCGFLKTSATYLGHEITAGTIQPGQAKIKCVADYKQPRNVHEIRQFIGLTSYFRKFIHNFAQIARPLTELTKKDVEWQWGPDQEVAFQTLKQRLVERPVLGIYDKDAKTELHTDASSIGLGGILMQYQRDGSLKPIAYFSRVTSAEEKHYHSYELETLAVVESLKRFRIYLTGIPVKVVTDCAALRTTLIKKDLIPRIARWWLAIQDFDLEIEYRPGERMRHVDALSRNPVPSCVLMIDNSDWLITLQMQDDEVQSILRQLREQSTNPDITNNYMQKDGVLYRTTLAGNRFVIPKLAKYGLLQKLHDQIGHPGFDRCEQAIKAQFWFKGMTRFIRKYISSCLQCAFGKGNYGRLEGELHPITKVDIPMHTLHADHLGPFVKTRKGNTYILVIIDAFTKFVFAKAAKNCSSFETIRLLKEVLTQFGNSSRIITDRGKAFTSRYFKQFSEEMQFRHVLNAIASPRSNGQVERVNRTLLDGLNTMSESECLWDNKLPDIVWGINNTPHATTGFTPFSLMFAHENTRFPAVPTDSPQDTNSQREALQARRDKAKLRIDKSMTLMKSKFDRKRKRCLKYRVGQLVLWKGGIARDTTAKVARKLDGLYTGPYKVTKADHSLDRYTICSVLGMKGYRRFSAVVRGEVLRPYKSTMDEDESSGSDRDINRDDLIDLLES